MVIAAYKENIMMVLNTLLNLCQYLPSAPGVVRILEHSHGHLSTSKGRMSENYCSLYGEIRAARLDPYMLVHHLL